MKVHSGGGEDEEEWESDSGELSEPSEEDIYSDAEDSDLDNSANENIGTIL